MHSNNVRDIQKAANLIRDAEGKVVGRTRLQKIAYLLELTGLREGFDFEYRHYGPYSEQLADAISTAAMVGLLSEEERVTNWGETYSIFTTAPSSSSRSPSSRRQELITKASTADPVALELAATAAFLAEEGEQDAWAEIVRRKPEKAADHLRQAKSLYRELLTVPTPRQLPKID